MGLMAQLAAQKETIVEKWFARAIAAYPAETARFLRSNKDRFANPVGQTTHQSLNILIDLLAAEPSPGDIHAALDPIMRIRAIQELTPSQATRFLFDLKQVLRELIHTPRDSQTIDEMALLDRRIDEMALLAFETYMQCREKVFDLKANEVKQRTYRAFSRAGLIKEAGDE